MALAIENYITHNPFLRRVTYALLGDTAESLGVLIARQLAALRRLVSFF